MPEYDWPGGPHGLAMWFSGAPDTAKLEITEFWHPALVDVCDNGKRSVVASARRGEIRWNRRDKATKALAHFTVTALVHLLRTDGDAAFGYSGPMTKTLYNSFKWHRNRSEAMKNIFSVAGQSAKLDVFPGEAMEHVLIAIEGAEDAPVVRMSEAFHDPSTKLTKIPLYVFWEDISPTHPNWELTRIVDVKRLDYLARLIAESCGDPKPAEDKSVDQDESDGTELDAAQLAKRRFIQLFFSLLHGGPERRVTNSLAQEFVCGNVRREVPESVSGREITKLCERLGAVDETYRWIVKSLATRWEEFKPSLKSGVREYLVSSVLADDLSLLPELTADEKAHLRIRWEDADWEYQQEKQEALARCKRAGFDASTLHVDIGRLEPVFDILMQLLKKKVHIDREHIRAAGARLSKENRSMVQERAGQEFSDLRECLLDAMSRQYGEYFQRRLSQTEEASVGPKAPAVFTELERYLRPFGSRWYDLEASI